MPEDDGGKPSPPDIGGDTVVAFHANSGRNRAGAGAAAEVGGGALLNQPIDSKFLRSPRIRQREVDEGASEGCRGQLEGGPLGVPPFSSHRQGTGGTGRTHWNSPPIIRTAAAHRPQCDRSPPQCAPSRQQCGAATQQCFEELPQLRHFSSALRYFSSALRYFSSAMLRVTPAMLRRRDEALRMKPPKCFSAVRPLSPNCAGALHLWQLVGPLAFGVPPLPTR